MLISGGDVTVISPDATELLTGISRLVETKSKKVSEFSVSAGPTDDAVQAMRLCGFLRKIHQFRYRRLHSISHFVLVDTCGTLRVTDVGQLDLVQLIDGTDDSSSAGRVDSLGIGKK